MNHIRCRLDPGTRLVLRGDNVFIFRARPLKVWKVKRSAFDLLARCDGERTLGEILSTLGSINVKDAHAFLEKLAVEGVVQLEHRWTAIEPPPVSVVVAVRNRAEQIVECIQSLLQLSYPVDKLEIIVVDDASQDSTPEQISKFPVKAILMSEHIGQSACRNAATRVANGEVVAFTDSDCVVDPGWLSTLVPLFADPRVGAVGGIVAPLSRASKLQRYEEVKSPLYQGSQQKEVGVDSSPSYLSTCNFLARKKALEDSGGLDESMALGEDVDLTWRLCELGLKVVYSPRGKVHHRHRDRVREFFKRRALYASSEALLLRKHPKRRRLLFLPVAFLLSLALLSAGLAITNLPLALFAIAPFIAELALKEFRLARVGLRLPLRLLVLSTLRSYGAALYHILSNLSRYYLIPLLLLGLISPYLLAVASIALLTPAIVDYLLLRPALNAVSFFAFYILENIAYQLGVVIGCFRHRTLLPFLPRVRFV